MFDSTDFSGLLREARQARQEAQRLGHEVEELAAGLRQAPPVGRWPRLTRASYGPRISVFSD